jgi:hypothetical protein
MSMDYKPCWGASSSPESETPQNSPAFSILKKLTTKQLLLRILSSPNRLILSGTSREKWWVVGMDVDVLVYGSMMTSSNKRGVVEAPGADAG